MLVGSGCPETNSGKHLIEIDEGDTEIACVQCAGYTVICDKCSESLFNDGLVNECCAFLFHTKVGE